MSKKSSKQLASAFDSVVANYAKTLDPEYGAQMVRQLQRLQQGQSMANTGSALVLKAFSEVVDADLNDAIAGAATINLFSQSVGVAAGTIKMLDPNTKKISREQINDFFEDADDFAATRNVALKAMTEKVQEQQTELEALRAENEALRNGSTS